MTTVLPPQSYMTQHSSLFTLINHCTNDAIFFCFLHFSLTRRVAFLGQHGFTFCGIHRINVARSGVSVSLPRVWIFFRRSSLVYVSSSNDAIYSFCRQNKIAIHSCVTSDQYQVRRWRTYSGKFDITVRLNACNALRSWKALQEKSKSFLLGFISISLSGICWEHCAHNTGHKDAIVRMSTTRWNNNAQNFFASDRYQNVAGARVAEIW